MSGPGGGGGDGGGGGGGGSGGPEFPPQEIDCTRISEKTVLNSPVPEVVGALKNGEVLAVKVHNGTSLVAVTENGKVAGALTPPLLPRIVECIEEGFEYVAIVLSVSGGECRVHVKLMSKA